MIKFFSHDDLIQIPKIADAVLACNVQPEVGDPSPLASVQAAPQRRNRLMFPPLHVIMTDDDGVLLGRVSLAPVWDPDLPFASAKTWQCIDFCVFQGAEPKVSYGLYAACAAAMRELGFNKLLNSEGRNLLPMNGPQAGAALHGDNMSEGEQDGDCCSPSVKRKVYRRLLDLAEISAVEMELYICNSDMFEHNQTPGGLRAPHWKGGRYQ